MVPFSDYAADPVSKYVTRNGRQIYKMVIPEPQNAVFARVQAFPTYMMATQGGPSNLGGAFKSESFQSCTLKSGTDGQPGAVYESQEMLPNRGLRSRKYFITGVRSNEMIEYDQLLVDKYDFSGDEDKAARSTTRISFGPSSNGDPNKCTVVFDAPKMNVFELRSHWPLIAFSPMIMLLCLVAGPCIYHETRQGFRRCQALTGKYLGNVSGGGIHSDMAHMMQNVTAMQQGLGGQGGQGPTAEQMQQMAQRGQGLTAEQFQQMAQGGQGLTAEQFQQMAQGGQGHVLTADSCSRWLEEAKAWHRHR
jgi:hypothetical protein